MDQKNWESQMNEKKSLKLLFTNIDEQGELIQTFRSVAVQLDIKLSIHYIWGQFHMKELLLLCKQEEIDVVIPTSEYDMLLLSQEKRQLESIGIKVLINSPEKIALCRDRLLTVRFFFSCDLHTPAMVKDWKNYEGGFPCLLVPVNGSCNLESFRVESKEEIECYTKKIFDSIIQPLIDGHKYIVDILCDLDGNPVSITMRQQSSHCGELVKAGALEDGRIIKECLSIIKKFRPVGLLTVHLIRDKKTAVDYFIKVVPQFGGGESLSENSMIYLAEKLLQVLVPYGSNEKKRASISRGLLIIGAGGHGRVAAEVAEMSGQYSQIAFLDDNVSGICAGIKVVGKADDFMKWFPGNAFFVAIGDAAIRRRYLEKLCSRGAEVATLIHRTAYVSKEVTIGYGTIIMANAVINTGSRIGNGVIINTGSIIEHDNRIGDFSHIAVGCHLGGEVTTGGSVWLGIGATVRNGVSIVDSSTIGAGAVVVKDIATPGIYTGIPARKSAIRRSEK